MLASYTTVYSGITGLEDKSVFEWQCAKYKVRGLAYEAQGVIGYQMPIALRLAGVMVSTAGYYDGAVYGNYDKTFDGDFAGISISPLAQFKFGKNDSLTCLFNFSSRRSYEKKVESDKEILNTKVTGREWYFKRIALSWSHKFM